MKLYDDAWWQQRSKDAQDLADERLASDKADTALVVVCAQHPLVDGVLPGEEFRRRLNKGVEISREVDLKTEIYIPGNRHRGDMLSLSDAGCIYLAKKHGINPRHLHGQDWNTRFRPLRGVYNAGQEADVAASAFKSYDRFREMHVVVSPGQHERVVSHFIAQGVVPSLVDLDIESLRTDKADLYHGDKDSFIAKGLAFYTRHLNPTWDTGVLPYLSRIFREPSDGDINTIQALSSLEVFNKYIYPYQGHTL